MGVPGSGANADTGAVVLGLQTLGSFDFEGHSLLGFVQHCATHYLHSEEKLIRFEAVKTCSSLLKGTLDGLAGRKSQVWEPLTQFFSCFLFVKNHRFASRAIQSPLVGETLFSSVPPSNYLVSLSDP